MATQRVEVPCVVCEGAGFLNSALCPCPECQGAGKVLAAPAAPGVTDDEVIRAAKIIADSPLIDAPKLHWTAWCGLARHILDDAATAQESVAQQVPDGKGSESPTTLTVRAGEPAVAADPGVSALVERLGWHADALEKSSDALVYSAKSADMRRAASALAALQTSYSNLVTLHFTCIQEANQRAESAERRVAELSAQLAGARAQYQELIMQVARKHPGETRHETALRYLRRAEEPTTRAEQGTVNRAPDQPAEKAAQRG